MQTDSSSPHQSTAGISGDVALIHPRYEIRDGISEDASGILYRGRAVSENRKVAIRLFDGEIKPHVDASGGSVLPSLLRILQATEFLRTEKGMPFAVFDMPEGRCLDNELGDHVFIPVNVAARIALEVSLTIRALHVHGLCHGHVNAQNVFLKRQPSGRLDIQLLYHPLVGDPTKCNLPGYLSPELCEGERALRKSDDHWAICVLFYRMVFGKMPFAGVSGAEVLQSIRQNGIVFPRMTNSLSPLVMEFIRKSLGVTASERPDGRELNLRFKAILKKQYSATEDMEPITGVLPVGDRPTVPPDINAIAVKDAYREAVKRTTRPVAAEDTLLLGKDEEMLHSDTDDTPEMDFDFDPDLEIDIETEIDVRETQTSRPLDYRGQDISNRSVDFMVLPPILMSSAEMTNSTGASMSEWPPENPMAFTKASIDTSCIAVPEQYRMKRKRLVKQVFFNISLGMVAAVALYLLSGMDRFGIWHAEDAIRVADTPIETPLANSLVESESVPETSGKEPDIEARESIAAAPASAGEVFIRMENLPVGAYILVNGSRAEHPIAVQKSARPLAINVVVDERIIYSTILLPEGDQVITLPVKGEPKKVKGRVFRRAGKGKSVKPPIRGKNNLGKLSSNPHQLRENPFLEINVR